jgi:hypothetical protein
MVNLSAMYEIFEKDYLEAISFRHIDNGVLRSLIERWPEDDVMKQWCEHFIRLNGAEIENLMEEVLYARNRAREFKALQRGR